MTIYTAWADGSPKSTHTVFTIPAKRPPDDSSAYVDATCIARTTEMLRFKGDVHNFTPTKTNSKLIHRATGAMRTI